MMAKLWLLLLLCWAWSPLCASYNVGFVGTPKECEKAHFVPGYNLGGEGFDIVTMERKGAYVIDTETWKLGNGTCKLYRNSYMNRENQKVPAAVEDWRVLPKCRSTVSSTVYDSVETLVNASTSAVSNNWKNGLDITGPGSVTLGFGFGGSHSKESTFSMQKSKQDHYTFMSHSVQCSFYSYRMKNNPPWSRDFKSVVSSLPPHSAQTAHLYRRTIDTFGTHYITQVVLGGQMKSITSVRTCKASINGFSTTDVQDCLSVEASVGFASTASIKTMVEECKRKKRELGHYQSFSSMFSERFTEIIGGNINGANVFFHSDPIVCQNWLNSLKNTPEVIRYSIQPLHTILPLGHFASVGLKHEVETYIKKNAVLKKCSETCKIGHQSSKRDPCACVCNRNQNLNSNCCPTKKGLATLKVFKLYAKGLYGDTTTQTDGSVEVRYGNQVSRTAIISNDDNPEWPNTFEFGPITINSYDRLKLTVYDEDSYWDSDLLGECSVKLHSATKSYFCTFDHGTFYFSYKVECAASLGGDQCQQYTPSPMSESLAKVFYTRNGVLSGEAGIQQAVSKSVRQFEVRRRADNRLRF
ncbi:perforin-1-like [Notolabrus celidotus]|uniref:perforin-1-like n=1 Tax=Notolabrus celidotus TaxID=1203425 RepID=UPI00149069E6|nr:perforin-1-like [Notolabrus celidotus]